MDTFRTQCKNGFCLILSDILVIHQQCHRSFGNIGCSHDFRLLTGILICNVFHFYNIGCSHKFCNKAVARMFVDFIRSRKLLDSSLAHNADFIRHCKCFFLVVSNTDGCNSQFLCNSLDFKLHIVPQIHVQCSKRFIQKKQRRIIYNRSCQRHTLLLPTTELFWISFFQPG